MFFFEHSEHCFTFFVFEDDDVVVVLCPNIRQLRTISKEKVRNLIVFVTVVNVVAEKASSKRASYLVAQTLS